MPAGIGDVIVTTGFGNCCVARLIDKHHLRLDHEVAVSRRDDAVLEFDKIDD